MAANSSSATNVSVFREKLWKNIRKKTFTKLFIAVFLLKADNCLIKFIKNMKKRIYVNNNNNNKNTSKNDLT